MNFHFSLGRVGGEGAWRIIPGLGYVVNKHGDRFRPLSRDVGPLPNGSFMAYKWG